MHVSSLSISDFPSIGVTIVQLRDKTNDTGELIRIAKLLHAVTKPKGIPLLINDRVDVALAAGVEGVHIGQDDIGMFNPSLFIMCKTISMLKGDAMEIEKLCILALL